jgi:hypothetical protein
LESGSSTAPSTPLANSAGSSARPMHWALRSEGRGSMCGK